jgi:hypothetical protein
MHAPRWDAGAPHVDHPREEFLGRRPCFAVVQILVGQRQTQFDWTRLQLYAADRRAFHQPGLLTPCRVFSKGVFSKCVFSKCAARPRPEIRDHDGGRAGATAVASAPACRGAAPRLFRDAGRATPRPVMPLASNAADRTSGVNDGRMPVPRMNSRSDGARLWSRPYTLWRADRPAICGRNAVVH